MNVSETCRRLKIAPNLFTLERGSFRTAGITQWVRRLNFPERCLAEKINNNDILTNYARACLPWFDRFEMQSL